MAGDEVVEQLATDAPIAARRASDDEPHIRASNHCCVEGPATEVVHRNMPIDVDDVGGEVGGCGDGLRDHGDSGTAH
jgi:hypothetical protein